MATIGYQLTTNQHLFHIISVTFNEMKQASYQTLQDYQLKLDNKPFMQSLSSKSFIHEHKYVTSDLCKDTKL